MISCKVISRSLFKALVVAIVGLCCTPNRSLNCELPDKTTIVDSAGLVTLRMSLMDSVMKRMKRYEESLDDTICCLRISPKVVESSDRSGFLLFEVSTHSDDSMHIVVVDKVVVTATGEYTMGQTGWYLPFVHTPKGINVDSLVRYADRILPGMLRQAHFLSDNGCQIDSITFRNLPMYSYTR